MSYDFVDFIASYGIFLFGINLGLSFIGASIAGKKGYSYGGFLCLGIFVAFWLSLIIAASCKPRAGSRYLEEKNQQYNYRFQNPNQQPPNEQNAQPQQEGARFCTGCGAPVNPGMAFCPTCGKKDPAATPPWQGRFSLRITSKFY